MVKHEGDKTLLNGKGKQIGTNKTQTQNEYGLAVAENSEKDNAVMSVG